LKTVQCPQTSTDLTGRRLSKEILGVDLLFSRRERTEKLATHTSRSLNVGHGCRIYVADGQVSGGTDWAQLYGCSDGEVGCRRWEGEGRRRRRRGVGCRERGLRWVMTWIRERAENSTKNKFCMIT
jgi:hypothetical protein